MCEQNFKIHDQCSHHIATCIGQLLLVCHSINECHDKVSCVHLGWNFWVVVEHLFNTWGFRFVSQYWRRVKTPPKALPDSLGLWQLHHSSLFTLYPLPVEFQRQSLVFRIISIIKTMFPCLLFENDANVCPEVCAVLVPCHLAGAGILSLSFFYTLER